MHRIAISAVVIVAAASPIAVADGIIHTLPKDRTWVQYKMSGSETSRNGKVEKFRGTVTVSSVGTETIDGVKHRWIEFRHTWQNVTRGDKDDRVRILKCLIPEKQIGKGKTPSAHIVRGWRSGFLGSKGKGRPRSARRSDGSGSWDLSQPGGAFLGGPLKNSKTLKPKTIETKLGKFKSGGLYGEFEVKTGRANVPFTLTVWTSDKVPFGVARFEITGKEAPRGDAIMMVGTVAEKGIGAKSELPEQK